VDIPCRDDRRIEIPARGFTAMTDLETKIIIISQKWAILPSSLLFLLVKIVPVLLGCHPRFFNQLAEKAGTECLVGMNWDREMDGISLFYKDIVAPLNMVHDPSCPFEGGDMPIPPRPGEFRHN
jgi:hypothetical protein